MSLPFERSLISNLGEIAVCSFLLRGGHSSEIFCLSRVSMSGMPKSLLIEKGQESSGALRASTDSLSSSLWPSFSFA